MFRHVAVVLVVEYGRSWQFVGDLLERFNLELVDVRNASQIHEILALKWLVATLEGSSSARVLVVFGDLRSLDARFEIGPVDKINIEMRVDLHVHGGVIHFIDRRKEHISVVGS